MSKKDTMKLFNILLFPLAFLYGVVTSIRNYLYDKGYFKTVTFNIFTLSVGNLSVGGTGKTPHVEYLIRLLQNHYQIATLSRGYGRKTKGFRLATQADTPQTLGDEPMQFYQKFGKSVPVSVGERRVEAIEKLLFQCPDTQVVLLDDAYQHRAIGRHLNILLTDYNMLFYQDFVLPQGRLREPRTGAKRADAIIVSKCPESLTEAEIQKIDKATQRYIQTETPVFFSTIQYGKPIAFGSETLVSEQVVVLTGIANPKPFEDYAHRHFRVLQTIRLADHYDYTIADIEKFRSLIQSFGVANVSILTTEKDYVKLAKLGDKSALPLFFVPIEIRFLRNEANKFNNWVLERVQKFYKTQALPYL